MDINRKRVIAIGVMLCVVVALLWGMGVISNMTGHAITGAAVSEPTIEQEYFDMNNQTNETEVDDGEDNNRSG